MDIRDILKSFDQLTEGDSTVHKAGPGGYGNKHGSEDVTDQYGKPIGRMSLGKLGAQNEPKRGKGRPVNPDKAKEYDSTALNKAMGIGKAPKPTGKPSVKHSLKEYFDQMDQSLVEADAYTTAPMPGAVAVKDASGKVVATAKNPQAAAAFEKGDITLGGDEQGMAEGSGESVSFGEMINVVDEHEPKYYAELSVSEISDEQFKHKIISTYNKIIKQERMRNDFNARMERESVGMAEGDVGKHNNATTGFDALVRKLTPKYGKEAATKIAGAQLKKMSEAEAPQNYAQSSPISSNNRSDFALEEGKKGVNPFAKKDATDKKKCPPMSHIKKMCQDGKSVAEICKMHPDCDQKELKQMVADCKKKLSEAKMPDANNNNIPDYAEDGKGKNDLKKKGAAPKKGVNPFAKKQKVKEGMDHKLQSARLRGKSHALAQEAYNCHYDDMEEARHYHEGFKEGLDECYGQMPILGRTAVGEMGQGPEVDTMASYGADELGEMDKTSYMKQQAIKTPGDTFKAFGQTMRDSNVLDEFAFEALDKQLNAILEGKEVSEGMTVSISKGQQGSPDSVSVSAQDGEADQLLSIIKSAGMGLFGGDEQNGYGAPQGSTQAPGGISVVDDHDGMMALMKKLSGNGGEMSNGDYESEEGSDEGHMHGHEETCESCGGMMEAGHSCGSGQQSVMGEDETEDQMTDEVAEANAPDSGADNTNADVAGQVGSDEALATDDAAQDMATAKTYSSPTEGKEDTTGEEAGEEEEEKKKEEMTESSFANLFRKIAMLSEESTSEKDAKAEKAGKKVAKDIEYDEDHKGKDDNKAEKAGKKVTKDIEYDDKKDKKDKVDESYANSADDTFEADIGFMMNVISGGLNKQKSTGQTTIPVIAGQKNRMGTDGLGNPMKESNDLLKDYMKLSGL